MTACLLFLVFGFILGLPAGAWWKSHQVKRDAADVWRSSLGHHPRRQRLP